MIKQWNKLRENWLVLLFSATLTVFGLIVFSSWNYRAEAARGAASLEYVDKENGEQNVVINKLDNRIDTKADKDDVESLHIDVREIRTTQLEIYKLLGGKDD
jgi:hypothetical protein